MLFSSTTFIYIFLPLVVGIYYIFLRKWRIAQNVFLALVSLFFYAWGEPTFVLVMLLSIMINYLFGLCVAKYKEAEQVVYTKLVVVVAVVFNIGLLFVFKYLSFACEIIQDVTPANFSVPQIALPIGISFFTFQAMSYVIDVYKGKGKAQSNLMNVALYISFFPQLIAGPIVRYETVAYEIEHRKETLDDFLDGFARFVVGFSKKVLLSNSLSVVADNAFSSTNEMSVALAWLGAICYTLQIYFDFSGYSDMAIGLGRMFGFHFLENFHYPYISTSVSEFWRRWHISLGSWFRDYIYIPLGGARSGKKSRRTFNLFVVWTLTGIWHGANWTFLLWGEMYFVLLVFEKMTGFDKCEKNSFLKIASWAYTMLFVVVGWVIFRADSVGIALDYLKVMFGFSDHTLWDVTFITQLRNIWMYLLAGCIFSVPVGTVLRKHMDADKPIWQVMYQFIMVAIFVLSLSSIISSAHNPFIYFNF